MPISWQIHDGLVWIKSEDPWSIAEWKAAVDAFLAHPEFRQGMGIINDRRGLRRVPTAQEVAAAINFVKSREVAMGNARWAMVVGDPTNYGMGRMAQSLIAGALVSVAVFNTMAEAEAWVRQGTAG